MSLHLIGRAQSTITACGYPVEDVEEVATPRLFEMALRWAEGDNEDFRAVCEMCRRVDIAATVAVQRKQ